MFIWQNGVVTGAPYLLMLPVIIGSGAVADMLQKKKIVSTTNVRKLANSLGKQKVTGLHLLSFVYHLHHQASHKLETTQCIVQDRPTEEHRNTRIACHVYCMGVRFGLLKP